MNGLVFYKGKSQLDRKDIVGIVIGFNSSSKNGKTGDLLQTHILVDNGKFPHENAAFGSGDSTICGDCPHRGSPEQKSGTCYVNTGQGPHAVYSAYLARKYDKLNKKTHKSLFKDRFLRMGAYGDPTAIPFDVWDGLIGLVSNHTGYTHQWRTCDQRFRNLCMASCDNDGDYITAKHMGWRTFRVKSAQEIRLATEITCPASKELNTGRQCEDCMACNGARQILDGDKRRDIVINVHGMAWKINRFNDKKLELPLIKV